MVTTFPAKLNPASIQSMLFSLGFAKSKSGASLDADLKAFRDSTPELKDAVDDVFFKAVHDHALDNIHSLIGKGLSVLSADEAGQLQAGLQAFGYDIKTDNKIGTETKTVVAAFQRYNSSGEVSDEAMKAAAEQSLVEHAKALLDKGMDKLSRDERKQVQTCFEEVGISCGPTGADGIDGRHTSAAEAAFRSKYFPKDTAAIADAEARHARYETARQEHAPAAAVKLPAANNAPIASKALGPTFKDKANPTAEVANPAKPSVPMKAASANFDDLKQRLKISDSSVRDLAGVDRYIQQNEGFRNSLSRNAREFLDSYKTGFAKALQADPSYRDFKGKFDSIQKQLSDFPLERARLLTERDQLGLKNSNMKTLAESKKIGFTVGEDDYTGEGGMTRAEMEAAVKSTGRYVKGEFYSDARGEAIKTAYETALQKELNGQGYSSNQSRIAEISRDLDTKHKVFQESGASMNLGITHDTPISRLQTQGAQASLDMHNAEREMLGRNISFEVPDHGVITVALASKSDRMTP